jgi:hypothetical protein
MTGATDLGVTPRLRERLEGYFDTLVCAFARAAAHAGLTRRAIRVGNRVLELQFAGESLVGALLPAFGHLRTEEPVSPHATIGLWDTMSTGVDLPKPSWPAGALVRGLLSGYTHGQIQSAWEHAADAVSIINMGRGLGFFHVPAADSIPPQESSFPLRTLLNWWLGAEGRPLVHAGAVGTDRGAVLLAGMGGSGKSSTALACLEAGLLYCGDDFVSVQPDDAEVFSLYAAAKLFPDDLARFPALRSAVVHPGGPGRDKAVLLLHPHFTRQLAPNLPVRAILLPRVTRRPSTELRPATPGAALRQIAPSTLMHLPGARDVEFQAMARLAARTPSYVLDLGTGRHDLVAQIRGVIDAAPPVTRA